MLKRPGTLPRTLRGVGGIRLINMPGVKYPDSVLQGRKGTDRSSGKAHAEAPEWGISTRDAAALLGVSSRSVRVMLNRQKAAYRLVARKGKCPCLYWDRRVVDLMLAKRMPLVTHIPEKLCSAREACLLLLVSRSSLSRYVRRKLLHEYRLRHVTKTGIRLLAYYMRAEVRLLAARRKAARIRAENELKERLTHESGEQQAHAKS